MAARLRLLLPLVIVAQLVLGAQPASACSCGRPSVEDVVTNHAVYIAQLGHWPAFIPFVGTEFQVERVLKGPTVQTVRLEVLNEGSHSCGVAVERGVRYVIGISRPDPVLSICTEVSGEGAVARAIEVLGEGEPVQDSIGTGPMLLFAFVGGVAAFGLMAFVSVRRRAGTGA